MGVENLDAFLNNDWRTEGSGDEYEDCWYNGNYTDQYCPCCPYRNECSGYDDKD